MSRLKQKLLTLLKNAERVAILGIGSELRADDAVGLLVLEHLRKKMAKQKNHQFFLIKRKFKTVGAPLVGDRSDDLPASLSAAARLQAGGRAHLPAVLCPALQAGARPLHLRLFNGGTAPENLTGEIRRFKPGHLIMIDAVELGKRPGTIVLLDLKRIENTVFLTHKLPLKLMLDYLAAEMTFTTVFIGIQPKSLVFGVPVSKPVNRAGRELADALLSSFGANSMPGILSRSIASG